MVNVIWVSLLLVGIAVAAATGRVEVVSQTALLSAQKAVEVAFELVGVMALWLGLLRIAEEGGLMQLIARALRPFTRLLFPSVPPDHPAVSAMAMNISANALGLGNAATPFGLKAMQELQKLNLSKDEASDAMCTFLAINTSCVTLLPATIIGIRVAAGSINPTEIVGPTIFATSCGMVAALTADIIWRRLRRLRG